MRILFRSSLFVVSFLVLTSMTVKPESEGDGLIQKQQKAAILIQGAIKDGSGLSFRELRSIAKEVKGESLTLKELIALKVFKKKLSAIEKANNITKQESTEGKSQVIALILCILVGGLGIHRFYLGYTWQGVVQLLTAGGCGIWWLIDLIRIITGDLKPKNGEYGKTL